MAMSTTMWWHTEQLLWKDGRNMRRDFTCGTVMVLKTFLKMLSGCPRCWWIFLIDPCDSWWVFILSKWLPQDPLDCWCQKGHPTSKRWWAINYDFRFPHIWMGLFVWWQWVCVLFSFECTSYIDHSLMQRIIDAEKPGSSLNQALITMVILLQQGCFSRLTMLLIFWGKYQEAFIGSFSFW